MADNRLNFRLLAVGSMGVGKTTMVLGIAVKTGKNIIVLDDVFNDAYTGFEVVNMDSIKTWKGGKCVLIIPGLEDFETCLQLLKTYQANAFVILEDSGRYIDSTVNQKVRSFVIDHRKHNFDICFMYHTLSDVPPYICRQHSELILFKSQDNWAVKLAKYPNWHQIAPVAAAVNKNKSFNYCQVVTK